MSKPNILFLFPDQHRGDWLQYKDSVLEKLGMKRLPIRMPNVERLMEEGVTFTNAVTPSPLCAPARACLAAGMRYHRCDTPNNDNDYPLELRTFYSELKDLGYSVGGVGKFDLHKKTKWWGLDGWIDSLEQLGFTHAKDNAGKIDAIVSGKDEPKDPYMKYLYDKGLAKVHIEDMRTRLSKDGKYNIKPTPLPEEAYCDNWITGNAITMLKEFPKDKPWFMQVNFTGPHDPWDVTQRMRENWSGISFPAPNMGDPELSEKAEGVMQNYAAMLENIDRNIGLILDELYSQGQLENTVIVYSSDHGEMMGDFDLYSKRRPQRGSVSIPLVIKGKEFKKGAYSEALVELQDLAATFVELAGSNMNKACDSMSLCGIAEGREAAHREFQVSAYENWRMISDGTYKLITESEDTRLYNIRQDPWENNNIAADSGSIVDAMLEEMNRQFYKT